MAGLLDAGFNRPPSGGRAMQTARADAVPAQERQPRGFLIPSAEASTLEALTATSSLAFDDGDEPTIIVSGSGTLAPPRSTAKATPAAPPAEPMPADRQWGIQVGAFYSAEPARQAAEEGMRDVGRRAPGAKPIVAAADPSAGKRLYRARLIGLSESQARQACAALAKKKKTCMPVTPAETMKQLAQFN
ncbi:MAG: hypothetical protein FJX59_21225 [Alphaproteobacteria bacterium]|nr:hypothetical protein [Alphaproteobacteria bacterium]